MFSLESAAWSVALESVVCSVADVVSVVSEMTLPSSSIKTEEVPFLPFLDFD